MLPAMFQEGGLLVWAPNQKWLNMFHFPFWSQQPSGSRYLDLKTMIPPFVTGAMQLFMVARLSNGRGLLALEAGDFALAGLISGFLSPGCCCRAASWSGVLLSPQVMITTSDSCLLSVLATLAWMEAISPTNLPQDTIIFLKSS